MAAADGKEWKLVIHGGAGVIERSKMTAEKDREIRGALDRSLDMVMSRLRQKLGDDPKRPRFFRTIWGTGYMFIGRPS